MSVSDKRKAMPTAGPSAPKRVRIDDATRRPAKPAQDTDFFDGDPEIEEEDQRRLRKDQRRGRIDDRGEDLSASDDSDADQDSDAEPDAGSHRRRAERKRASGAKDAAADDDEDMFDFSDPDDDGSKGKRKAGKADNYLKLGELEQGQDFGSKGRSGLDADDQESELLRGGRSTHDDDDEDADPDLELEDEDEEEDADDLDLNAQAERSPPASPGGTPLEAESTSARRRRNKTKAPKVTGFNMKAEMRTGKFDADGNYHENARDPHAQHDSWLAGVYSKSKILDARKAQQARERAARDREAAAQAQDGDEDDVKRRLVELMHRHETVQRTLRRLGKVLTERKKSADRAGVAEAAAEVETVTHLASVLMSRFGRLDIYDHTYTALLQDVHKSGLVRNTFDPAAKYDPAPPTPPPPAAVDADAPAEDEGEWEYRWTPAYLAAAAREAGTSVDPEIETFGPFGLADLRAWADQGYFGDGGHRILLRRAASKDAWTRYDQLPASASTHD